MPARTAIALPVMLLLLAAIACSGGDGSSTPTPSSNRPVTGTPDPSLGPAEAFVMFGSPDATEEALKAAIEAGGPSLFFLAGESRDENSFDGAELPGDALARGVRLAGAGSEAYDGVFEGDEALSGVREGYDAVYLIALAAAAANSTDPEAIRDHLVYVANSPGEIVNPGAGAFAAAVGTLEEGGDVNFIGASGQVDFTANGDSAKGRVDVWRLLGQQIIDQEVRDVDLAAEVGAEVPQGVLNRSEDTPDGPLRIGALLPLSTDVGAQVSAMELAVEEINDAGGLFGEPIELLTGDSGDDAAQAASSAEDMADQGVSAIIGPLSLEGAAAVAGAVQLPQIALTTSAALPLAAGSFVVRGISGEALQTPTLANLAVEGEVEVVCVMFEPGGGNEALAYAFKEAFEHKGGAVRLIIEATDEGVSEADVTSCLGV